MWSELLPDLGLTVMFFLGVAGDTITPSSISTVTSESPNWKPTATETTEKRTTTTNNLSKQTKTFQIMTKTERVTTSTESTTSSTTTSTYNPWGNAGNLFFLKIEHNRSIEIYISTSLIRYFYFVQILKSSTYKRTKYYVNIGVRKYVTHIPLN